MKSKKNLSLRTAGMIVGVLALIVLAGCGNAGAADDTGLTKEEAQQAAIEAFAAVDTATGGPAPDCLTVESGDDYTTFTFTNCVFEGTSVNGKMTIGNPSEILTTSSGSLVLSGAGIPDSPLTVSWNISIESGSTVLVTGQITVDGTTYSYDELGVTYGG